MSTPQEIADGWAKHFETLSDRHECSFDREFKCHISREMQNINESLSDESSLDECPIITTEEMQAAARLAHRGKAAVEDGELMNIPCLAGNFYINYWQSYLMLSYSFPLRQ